MNFQRTKKLTHIHPMSKNSMSVERTPYSFNLLGSLR